MEQRTCPECGALFDRNPIGRPREFCTRKCTMRFNNRRYRERDPDAAKERNRLWREANAERHRANARQWYWDNHEYAKGNYGRWYTANPEKGRETGKRERRKRRARMAGNLAIPYTQADLIARLSMFAGCWQCGGRPEEIDHTIPVAKGGPDVLANLRPACRACNRSRRDAWPVDVRRLVLSPARLP